MPGKTTHPIVFLEGKRLNLRPLEMADEPMLRRWFCDESTRSNLAMFWPVTESFQKKYIENNGGDEKNMSFAIVLKTGHRPIGTVGYHGIRWKDRTVEFGIAICEPDARSKGYGTEATLLLLRYLFHSLNLNRVQLGVWDFNKPAIRTYEKIGFTKEGNQRQHGFVNGRYVDHYMYGMLASEFNARYAASSTTKSLPKGGRPN